MINCFTKVKKKKQHQGKKILSLKIEIILNCYNFFFFIFLYYSSAVNIDEQEKFPVHTNVIVWSIHFFCCQTKKEMNLKCKVNYAFLMKSTNVYLGCFFIESSFLLLVWSVSLSVCLPDISMSDTSFIKTNF